MGGTKSPMGEVKTPMREVINTVSDVKNPLRNYKNAEKKAKWYLKTIEALANNPKTYERLHEDFIVYSKTLQKQKASQIDFTPEKQTSRFSTWNFLERLRVRKELDAYLRKTVSYLYMRDLGLDLNETDAQKKIDSSVSSLLKKIESSSFDEDTDKHDLPFLQSLMSKKEYQHAYYWLMLRLSNLKTHNNKAEGSLRSNQHTKTTDQENSQDGTRKLVKIIAGVLVHHLVMTDSADKKDPDKLLEIVQLGYAYGLTYPFVDDLLDSDSFLSESDKQIFSQALQSTLTSKQVPEYPSFENKSAKLKAIYAELKWAFEFLLDTLPPKQADIFFSRAQMFFEAQAIDRARRLQKASDYSLHDILTTVIVKSASSRLISRDLVADTLDQEFDHRTFCFGIYNQFNDDIKDIEEDQQSDNLTPYTWFLGLHAHEQKHPDSISSTNSRSNPYHYYWAVVYHLIYDLYKNNPSVKALFFERSLNALKSVYKANTKDVFEKLYQTLLLTPNKDFNSALYTALEQPQHALWFDKLVSTEVSTWLKNKKQHSQQFEQQYKQYKDFVNKHLNIGAHSRFDDGKLHEVANYSLNAGGKRIRAVMASALSIQQYGFNHDQQVAVNQLLEYMHSASLILDDLPSQDNAELRRGKASTHHQFNSVATAELASVYMMMRAIEVQASIECHPPKAVLSSLRYAANVTQAVCEGQLLDIKSSIQCKSTAVTVEKLEKISHFKTGLAIEAALVIPALLAEQDEVHIKQLMRLARHMGLMFQIRDDLLDSNGNETELGKPTGQDTQQSRVNFVTVMGEKHAITEMLAHYNDAQYIIKGMPKISAFFGELLEYIIYRCK